MRPQQAWRLFLFMVVILAGMTGLFWFVSPLCASAPPSLVILPTVLLGAALALLIEDRLFHSSPSDRREDNRSDLSQEINSQSSSQAAELEQLIDRLAIETAGRKRAHEDAATSDERFRSMADHILEGLTIIENGRTVYTNERIGHIFCELPEPDLRQRVDRFAVPEEKERLFAAIDQSDGKPEMLQYWILCPDGRRRCILERFSYTNRDDVARTFIVTTDITDRAQAVQGLEQAVENRTRELSTVLGVSTKIASILELDALLHLVLDELHQVIPYSGAGIFILKDDLLQLVALRAPNVTLPEQPVHLSLENAGSYSQVLQNQEALVITDVQGESPLALALSETQESPTPIRFPHARAWIGVPLVIHHQLTGMLSLTHSQPGAYTQQQANLALAIANQLAVAIENARLYGQAHHLAALEERQRLARELHDSVTQLLYGITLRATAAAHSAKAHGIDVLFYEDLSDIKDNALQALQEMRLLIFELNPPALQEDGLPKALQDSLDGIETRAGLHAELVVEGVGRLPRTLEGELYRIAMEALHNLVRYAHARDVSVELRRVNGTVSMVISDNGVGFDLDKARRSGGMGLHSMEQRARQIGGDLTIHSTPGRGTRIEVEAKIPEKSHV